jgi:hypothetical protein
VADALARDLWPLHCTANAMQIALASGPSARCRGTSRIDEYQLKHMMTWHDFVMQLLLIVAPAAIITLTSSKKR